MCTPSCLLPVTRFLSDAAHNISQTHGRCQLPVAALADPAAHRDMQDHRKLRVYAERLHLCVSVYKLTKLIPFDQRFTLTSQMQRSAMSVSLNIAEGAGRQTNRDFARFLDMAVGSSNEVECCLDLSVRLQFVKPDRTALIQKRVEAVRSMLCSLLNTIRGKRPRRQATG